MLSIVSIQQQDRPKTLSRFQERTRPKTLFSYRLDFWTRKVRSMDGTRREFLKVTTVGGVALSVFGFDLAPAYAQLGAFIIHVYMGTAMVRGGFTSIIRGEVSAAWAKLHHRLWYEQVTKRSPEGK